jgi:hypothetical protein
MKLLMVDQYDVAAMNHKTISMFTRLASLGQALTRLKNYQDRFNKKYPNSKFEFRLLVVSDLGSECIIPDSMTALLVENLDELPNL